MTFLNPLLLFGLIAAAIPIIIHLLNLRKLKTIEFSTLQFLKELQKTKMRRVKIRQWLLLALRTLLIISVVMAFSRPALKGSLAGFPLGGSTHARTTMVILLDDSPSMSIRNERGTLFSQASAAAGSILDLMKDGDEAYLVRLSEVHRTSPFSPSHTPAPLKSVLASIEPSMETLPYRDALGAAAKILGESRNFNQEVYLITDMQGSQFAVESRDTTGLFGENVRLFLVDVGVPRTVDNAGITSVEVASKIITRQKPARLNVSVQNTGASPLTNAVVSVYLDGTRVVQQSLNIPAGGSVTYSLQVVPKRTGFIPGYVQLEDDIFEQDNRRHFVLHVPERLRVLAVGHLPDDTRFPALALSLDQDSAATGLFRVEEITESRLSSSDLGKYDVLMVVGVKQFSSGDAERIAEFVNAGGGLLMFAGRAMDVANYNSVLFPKLGIPATQPQRSYTVVASYPPPAFGTFISFNKIELEHPLFAGMFEQQPGTRQQPSIESPRVYTAIAPQAGARGRTVISLSDGTSFLTEYEHGTGRILLFAVEAGLTWSDFALRPIFVPLVYRAGLYLSQTQSVKQVVAGQEIRVKMRLRSRTDKDAFVLRSPSGLDERVLPEFSPVTGLATFTSGTSSEAGVYELRKGTDGNAAELLNAIPVNISPEESRLTRIEGEELDRFFSLVGLQKEQIRPLNAAGNIDAEILQSRFGVELWKYFVILALLFALAEMVVGHEARTKQAEQ